MSNSPDVKNCEANHILCFNHGVDCMNNAVGEADMGDGKGVKFYCRKCMTYDDMFDIEDIDVDESLVFCQREWEIQK